MFLSGVVLVAVLLPSGGAGVDDDNGGVRGFLYFRAEEGRMLI
ncbi:hypothetical protein KP509_09G070900 [Ceratopteris richardii]|uniref:Uncharacterized protein n=1 Tax=Ceratopteris richardii TaxID=49495 RepID=A0A8T2U8K2_CERRI|nr:hypothetical protein KP509_09G070900 [Ceratopteris richardii]